MNFIKSEEELLKYIPNVLKSIEGEKTLVEKMMPYIEPTETWLADTFLGGQLFTALSQVNQENIRQPFSALVATEAFYRAVPSLDLVLTPNGFGIVSNENVAPASKERIERLLAALEMQRDNLIDLLLKHLPAIDDDVWLTTQQGQFFAATLFPNLALCDKTGITEHRWAKYLELRTKLMTMENSLAEEFYSQELMKKFRQIVIRGYEGASYEVSMVIHNIQSLEVQLLLGQCPPQQTFRDVVNYIRENPSLFPEWQLSDTAKWYKSPIFENKKRSGGFWF